MDVVKSAEMNREECEHESRRDERDCPHDEHLLRTTERVVPGLPAEEHERDGGEADDPQNGGVADDEAR